MTEANLTRCARHASRRGLVPTASKRCAKPNQSSVCRQTPSNKSRGLCGAFLLECHLSNSWQEEHESVRVDASPALVVCTNSVQLFRHDKCTRHMFNSRADPCPYLQLPFFLPLLGQPQPPALLFVPWLQRLLPLLSCA